jgi:McrBC 5-methylcytosine restriction system component.
MVELFEHSGAHIDSPVIEDPVQLAPYRDIGSKYFRNNFVKGPCFSVSIEEDTKIKVNANYYIGVDWLIVGQRYLYVAPKINKEAISNFTETIEEEDADKIETCEQQPGHETFNLDYLSMLSQCMHHPEVSKELSELLHIDWAAPEIPIKQEQDMLTPLLVTQFLNLLKRIVKKGLRKSYYSVEENLNNRIKGKILVGHNIKQNVLKNRLTKTYCRYQEFGANTIENRFLKKALQFSIAYIDNHSELFGSDPNAIKQLLNYCRVPFEPISTEVDEYQLKHIKPNPFYAEYGEAIRIGKLLLKRLSYSISKANATELKTPPYWIDMPLLFELYAYCFLKKAFPAHGVVKYQYSTYGNKLDFLVNNEATKMVIDAKYKLLYASKRIIHNDIRQVAGYARLTKVHSDLQLNDPTLIDCLIIYPDINNGMSLKDFSIDEKIEIKAYKGVYTIGIKLPLKNNENSVSSTL